MKILPVIVPEFLNPYPREIYDHLQREGMAGIEFGLNKFWLPDETDCDIVHIHWPSILVSELVNREMLILPPSFRSELFAVREVLHRWKQKAKIVYTLHNYVPEGPGNEFSVLLHQLIHQHADAVIHMGEFSRKYFGENYARPGQRQVVIPHNVYESYPDSATRAESRKRLKIGQKDFAVLVFGAVRNPEERDFIEAVFRRIDAPRKKLIAPRWYREDHSRYGMLYNLVKTRLENLKLAMKPHLILGNQRTSASAADVQYYFRAADVVLVPRGRALNSGILPLAFAFGKPVVAPRAGNITELLEASGNEPYEPQDASQAAGLVNRQIAAGALEASGKRNYDFGREHWSLAEVARQHMDLFLSLLAD